MTHHAKVLAAVVLWLVAILLMLDASIDEEPMLKGWALLSAMAATMPTLWLIFDHNRNKLRDEFLHALAGDRGRTEALVQAVACEFARSELPNLDERRSV